MAIADRFYIKVNDDDLYSSTGAFKTLRQIYTKNGKLISLSDLWHEVIKTFSTSIENPIAYRAIWDNYYVPYIGFSAEALGINFAATRDCLSDAFTPSVENRLYKGGKEFKLMHPYMARVLQSYDGLSNTWQNLSGTFNFNGYGEVNGRFPNSGVIQIQGAGGGSGGTNNKGDDCAGAGGGSGAFASIYFRIKNTKSIVTMTANVGAGGSAGGAGSGNGGTGGTSYVNFSTPSGSCIIECTGGTGGQTGDLTYTNGGDGGSVFINGVNIASGGLGGTSSRDPSSGANIMNMIGTNQNPHYFENDYIFVFCSNGVGGAGGGRGDDTGGTDKGQAGAGAPTILIGTPTVFNKNFNYRHAAKSGGVKGTASYHTNSGGGGASVLANGANGAPGSTVGYSGTLGSGAGGAGVGGNANREGARGGDGAIWILS